MELGEGGGAVGGGEGVRTSVGDGGGVGEGACGFWVFDDAAEVAEREGVVAAEVDGGEGGVEDVGEEMIGIDVVGEGRRVCWAWCGAVGSGVRCVGGEDHVVMMQPGADGVGGNGCWRGEVCGRCVMLRTQEGDGVGAGMRTLRLDLGWCGCWRWVRVLLGRLALGS